MNHKRVFHLVIALMLCLVPLSASVAQSKQGKEKIEKLRYVRLSKSKWVTESEIRLQTSAKGLTCSSVTSRGKLKLTVTSKYDPKMSLQSARVTTRRGKIVGVATVRIENAEATVTRIGQANTRLPCPRNVIVTSAPDWTDSVFTVKRYKPAGKKTQTFSGLWIHPTKKPLSLKFLLTRLGQDSVQRGGKSEVLTRFQLVLRGGSKYLVWRNQRGNLVRLISARSRKGGIALAGWEQATRHLNGARKE